MKVIQLSTFFHPSVGGVERQVEEIATYLQRANIQVEVFTTDATHDGERRMQRLDTNFRNVKVRRFRYLISLGYFFRFSPGLLWELFKADFDIIHLHNIHDAHLLGAIIIKVLRRKKLVLTGHNPFIVSSEKRGGVLHVGVLFYELVFRFFAGFIDRYIALLESEKLKVRKKFKWSDRKIAIIPNGIQAIFYQEGGDPEKFYKEWKINPQKWELIVGTVSRINYVKGIQNLEAAVKRLPKVLFIFAGGDGGYLSTLKRIYGRAENVIFTDQYIPSDEVRNFYQAIDLFLLPSIYEPFGMTLVEAMAQGKPVLATMQGGPQAIVDPSFGELLDPTDKQAWYDRINYYALHPEELPAKGYYARHAADKYQWEKVITEIVDMYKSLI